jgi:phage tail-like protein
MATPYPPVGFSFAVQILGDSSSATSIEAGFQEVSGISAEMKTDPIPEGGENRFVHKVPARISNDSNVVLKRGLIPASSAFGDWCRSHFSQGLNAVTKQKKIMPKDIIVHLLDVDTQEPIMSWAFARTFPVKWEISTLNAKDNSIVVESLTMAYAYVVVL